MLITNNPGFKAATPIDSLEPNREILVIDDDPIIRRVIEAYLTDEGYQVSICRDGQSAWERISSSPPAMLITDWNMPGMTGIELTQMVRASCQEHIYILVATSRSTEQDAVQAINAGADDFLVKPISQQELIARVKRGMNSLSKTENDESLSSKDPLTLAFNRRAFERDCLRRMSHARRNGEPLSCLLFDVDLFKHINDTYGHSAGDRALRQAASAIRAHLLPDDTLYRYGGDEFCVLLPATNEDDAMTRAKSIQASIAESAIDANGRSVRLRCSGGVASWREDMRAPGQLVDLADEALLLAKKCGRNQVQCMGQLSPLSSELTGANATALASTKASALMMTLPTTITCGTSIRQVATQLLQLRADSLPVVDQENNLIGVVAEQDLFQQDPHGGSWSGPIDSVMQTNFVSFESDTRLNLIWDFFSYDWARCICLCIHFG